MSAAPRSLSLVVDAGAHRAQPTRASVWRWEQIARGRRSSWSP